MAYALGVDTGDTFTDAVLFEIEKERIDSVAKVPTTHEDLSRGIFDAIDAVTESVPSGEVIQVSLSSTLATNAIVEDRGGPVGLLTLGWEPEDEHEFPRSERACIPGRFNARGEETRPLDTNLVEEKVRQWRDGIVGYAVSGYFSVRNPEHENEVRRIVREITDKPVITGHELSPELGFYERAVTAILNVKVIPIINSFLDGAENALGERGIEAPLMVMKSDGSLGSSAEIRKKPIETVFSGPAASVIGARWLSGRDDGVVVDLGGTTADIGILRDGLPSLDKAGVQVGDWRTKVQSLDLHTVGLGGDSRVTLDEGGNFEFGPRTAKPLAFAGLTEEEVGKIEIYNDTSFLERREEIDRSKLEQLGDPARRFYNLIGSGIVNKQEVINRAREAGLIRSSYYLRRLERLGLVRRVGLTPTDLLHVIGEYTAGSREAPRLGTEILSKSQGEGKEFAARLKAEFEKDIAHEVVKKFVLDAHPDCDFERTDLWIYCKNGGGEGLSVNFELDFPLIGIGAPAGVFLPRVASRLGGDFVEVENYRVGNAVGTVTGRVTRRFEVPLVENHETEEFFLFLTNDRKVINSQDEEVVLEEAKSHARENAKDMVREAGGEEVEVSVEAGDIVHGRTTLEVVAIGYPVSSQPG